MKIAHFKKFFLHNTETFVFNQIKNLRKCENFVVCRKLLSSSNFDYDELNNLKEIPFNINWNTHKFIFACFGIIGLNYFIDQKSLLNYLKEIKVDILHAHFGPDGNYILSIKKKLGVPLVVSFYGYDVSSFPKEYWGLAKRTYKKLSNDGDVFLAMSNDMKFDLINLGFPEEKIIIRHYGVDTPFFSLKNRDYSTDGCFNILQIGSLQPKKGHIYLLEAFNRIIKERKIKNIKLNIIGEGPLKGELVDYINKNDLQSFIDFIGFVPHSPKLIDYFFANDIFIHHSVTSDSGEKEGIPTTILEAMSTGMPVISTYHAGIPDVIKNDFTGYLTQEKDVDSLSSYLELLYHDRELRERLGQNALKFVKENYDISSKSQELFEIYKSLI